mgnify:CR=1 FL=1
MLGSLLVYMLILGLFLPIPANIVIDVSEAGVAETYILYNVYNAPTVIVHEPLGTPLSYYAYYLDSGELVPVEYNGSLILGVDMNGTVVLTYLTDELTSKEGDLWSLNIVSRDNVAIVLPENTVPLNIEPEPLYVGLNDSRAVILMPPGSINIEYTIYVPPQKTTPPPTSSSPTTPTETPTTTETPPPPTPTIADVGLWVAVLAIAIGAIVGILYKLRRRSAVSYVLDERDREVLNVIKELGGEATASQIMAALKIPKTSLYRRIRRLLRLGYIEEIGLGGRKVYKLKREP